MGPGLARGFGVPSPRAAIGLFVPGLGPPIPFFFGSGVAVFGDSTVAGSVLTAGSALTSSLVSGAGGVSLSLAAGVDVEEADFEDAGADCLVAVFSCGAHLASSDVFIFKIMVLLIFAFPPRDGVDLVLGCDEDIVLFRDCG